MLKSLNLRNFTVFEKASFEFGKGLNVIVGANGTGKSHVLKVGYAMDSAYASASQPSESEFPLKLGLATISRLGHGYHKVVNRDLGGQFPANTLSDLVRRPMLSTEAGVEAFVKGTNDSLSFTIDSVEANKISMQNVPAVEQPGTEPVFIPAKEVLTSGWLLGYNLYGGSTATDAELAALPVDKTYVDLLRKLSKPDLPSPEPGIAPTLEVIRRSIGGEVEVEKGIFYLVPFNQNRMGINMVAEGMRRYLL